MKRAAAAAEATRVAKLTRAPPPPPSLVPAASHHYANILEVCGNEDSLAASASLSMKCRTDGNELQKLQKHEVFQVYFRATLAKEPFCRQEHYTCRCRVHALLLCTYLVP